MSALRSTRVADCRLIPAAHAVMPGHSIQKQCTGIVIFGLVVDLVRVGRQYRRHHRLPWGRRGGVGAGRSRLGRTWGGDYSGLWLAAITGGGGQTCGRD